MDEIGRKENDVTKKYFKRFGQIAVEKGYITEEDVCKALKIQLEDDIHGKPHRYLSTILFQMGVIKIKEIEEVMNTVFQDSDQSAGSKEICLP